MGLAVAYQLARDGYLPVIFEAADRVGGMTASFDFSGQMIERYYHFHCTSDHDFLQILDELGLADKMNWVETKMGYWYGGKLQPWGNPLALLKFKGVSLQAKVRYGLHAFLATKRRDWKPLDNVEATGWIKRWVGNEAYDVLWRRLFELKFYEYTQNLSAAWIWSRIRRIGKSRFNLFHEKLGYLTGGSDTLLKGLRADIEAHGGTINLKSPVQKVEIDGNGIVGVVVNGKMVRFRKVISTVPLPYVPRMIPDLPQELLAKFRAQKNIAVVCVIAKLRRGVSENFWVNINDPEMDIPGMVEYTNLNPLAQTIIYVPFYMPAENPKYLEPDSKFIDKVKHYLKMINADLTESDFIDVMASRYRFAQPICEPGHLESLPLMRLPVAGLWVADTSYYYPEDRGISESIGFGRRMAKDAIL